MCVFGVARMVLNPKVRISKDMKLNERPRLRDPLLRTSDDAVTTNRNAHSDNYSDTRQRGSNVEADSPLVFSPKKPKMRVRRISKPVCSSTGSVREEFNMRAKELYQQYCAQQLRSAQ